MKAVRKAAYCWRLPNNKTRCRDRRRANARKVGFTAHCSANSFVAPGSKANPIWLAPRFRSPTMQCIRLLVPCFRGNMPSVSLAPETNAGNTSPLDSCPIQTSASPSTQSSSVTITNSSACLDSRDSGRNCRSSSPESVSHCSSSTSTLVQGYTSS